MVVADARDDAKRWRADIGAVQASSESDLDDVDLGLVVAESQPTDGVGQFEEGRLAMVAVAAESIGRSDLVDDFDKFSRLDGLGIDGEALFEVD